ncbi:MAG TPA: HEPN domain-containing protein [Ignavibacteria bacterium]|nr:HEPN domain-containing protein [Ignavibacteria bacterium]
MNDKNKNIDVEKIVDHWKLTSNEDFKTMIDLYNSKTYHWALFIGHISVEKLLKAYFVKTREKQAPPIHNLYRIAELSGLEMTKKYADWLDTITSFNLNARYDDIKREFFKQCTSEYTSLWIKQIKEVREWINQKL